MPIVNVSILEGRTDEFKEQIHEAIHRSLVNVFKIPESDYNQKIIEYNKNNWKVPKGKSDNFIAIEMFIFPGRQPETKKMLYQTIIINLEEIGINKADTFILLIEQPMENWGIRGGISANEIDLGFNTKV